MTVEKLVLKINLLNILTHDIFFVIVLVIGFILFHTIFITQFILCTWIMKDYGTNNVGKGALCNSCDFTLAQLFLNRAQ